MNRTTKWAAALSLCCGLSIGASSAQDPAAPPPGRGSGDPLTAALDANGDGTISPTEIENAASALKKLDRNGDGELTRDEVAPPGRRNGPQDGGFRGRGGAGRDGRGTRVEETPPAASSDAERKALAVLEELDSNRRGNMNVPREDGRLLRLLAETVGAENVVEIGTSNGYSAIWLALGLRSRGGRVTTHEIDPRRAEVARRNLERAGVAELVTIVEGDAHETVLKLAEPIDILFIDADKQGYLDYLEKLLPLVRPGGLILSHNMNRPAPDPKFIEAITTDADLDTVFLNMDDSGIAVSLKKTKKND